MQITVAGVTKAFAITLISAPLHKQCTCVLLHLRLGAHRLCCDKLWVTATSRIVELMFALENELDVADVTEGRDRGSQGYLVKVTRHPQMCEFILNTVNQKSWRKIDQIGTLQMWKVVNCSRHIANFLQCVIIYNPVVAYSNIYESNVWIKKSWMMSWVIFVLNFRLATPNTTVTYLGTNFIHNYKDPPPKSAWWVMARSSYV
jgi:hypothetical protein